MQASGIFMPPSVSAGSLAAESHAPQIEESRPRATVRPALVAAEEDDDEIGADQDDIPTHIAASPEPDATPEPATDWTQPQTAVVESSLVRQVESPAPRGPPAKPLTVEAPHVAENGSYYGELNDYGVPKTVHVQGYYRSDGTYVRGHYRAAPGATAQSGRFSTVATNTAPQPTPTYSVSRTRAENDSYYGQFNSSGVPKTVKVRGYYRKDGTYVRGYYRSKGR